MKKTKIIGLTGGIGSGKSTIAIFFVSNHIPVYFADDEAKKIMNNSKVLDLIKEKLGSDLFDGKLLNKQKLAQLVFSNPEKLTTLNSIIHPLVKKHFDTWVNKNAHFPFVIKEAAILFESGSYKNCDKIINVVAPVEERIQRVIKRDNCTEEQVLARMNNQWTDEQRSAKSDFIITNTTVNEALIQAKEILKRLNNL